MYARTTVTSNSSSLDLVVLSGRPCDSHQPATQCCMHTPHLDLQHPALPNKCCDADRRSGLLVLCDQVEGVGPANTMTAGVSITPNYNQGSNTTPPQIVSYTFENDIDVKVGCKTYHWSHKHVCASTNRGSCMGRSIVISSHSPSMQLGISRRICDGSVA